MIITLEELKTHLRIEHAEEDQYLVKLLLMSEATCLDFCLRDAWEGDPPEAIRLAILIQAAYVYTHREGDNPDGYEVMDRTVKSLLWPHRDVSKLL